ncbi:MAG: histone-lysine N-methyltransferase [Candidatus Adiutrix sp.]|jgi:isopropylmalate/homocitrate/citramalate synthase|nr:histone-lysine N-methyltransferase [Candidatus Adiutrix sp.]
MTTDNESILLINNRKAQRRLEIIDREDPELYRAIFPYSEVPRITFDGSEPSLAPARELLITDTTFRDGQQARPPYSVAEIVRIFQFLSRLGGPEGVIRKSEFFLYSEKDRQAVDACRELGLAFPKITSWIRAAAEDLKLVKEMNLTETGILTSISDYHIYMKLNLTRAKAVEKYLALVKDALALGITPRCHFEDVTRADVFGLAAPFAQKLKRLSDESGIKIIIRLCDTMGMGVTYPGAALPRSVGKLVRVLIDEAGYNGADLEWHGHNDFHKGFVNAAAAWLYGLGAVNGTLLGFGERTGNTPLEALAVEYAALTGTTRQMDLTAITDMARYFEKEIGHRIPPYQPLVGRDFNVTSAGIHADGLLKNEEIYNIFDTELILGRSPAISINDKSGVAGVTHWLNRRLNLSGENALDKRHPGIIKMNKAIAREYSDGRSTNMSNKEMEKLARHYLPGCFVSQFDRLKAKARELAQGLIGEMIENPEIRSMNPARQEPLMERWVTETPFVQFMYVTDQRGVKVTRNVVSLNEKSKFMNSTTMGVGANLSDRIWYVKPIEDGKIHVTDFYTSRFTGALCITVSGPIRDNNDEIIGILGLDIRFEDLAKMEAEDLSPAAEDDQEDL